MNTPSEATSRERVAWVLGIVVLLFGWGVSFGLMKGSIDSNTREVERLRTDVQGLENYIRDYFANRSGDS